METPVPTINQFFKKTHESKCEKIMRIYFKLLRVVFLLDFGFCESKSYKLNKIMRAITVLQVIFFCCLGVVIILDQSKHVYFKILNGSLILSYILSVLVLIMLNPKNSMFSFYRDLDSIDERLQANDHFASERFLLAINFIEIGLKTACYIYFGIDRQQIPLFIIIYWTVASLDILNLNYFFGLFILGCRIHKLVLILNTTDAGSSQFKSLLSTFKMIIELIARFKSGFDPLFIILLSHNVSQIMFHLLISMLIHGRSASNKSFPQSMSMILCYTIIESFLMILLAPVAAEKNIMEVEKLKMILHDKLMETDDIMKEREIARFIRYVDAHDLRSRVYHVVTLDAILPGRVISFCATYVIVIAQFIYK